MKTPAIFLHIILLSVDTMGTVRTVSSVPGVAPFYTTQAALSLLSAYIIQ